MKTLILLYSCHLSTDKVKVKNPFVAGEMEVFKDGPLTTTEYLKTMALIESSGLGCLESSGGHTIRGSDDICFIDWCLEPGLSGFFVLEGEWLNAVDRQFVLDLAQAGNMYIRVGDAAIATSSEQFEMLRLRYPNALMVTTENEFKAILEARPL